MLLTIDALIIRPPRLIVSLSYQAVWHVVANLQAPIAKYAFEDVQLVVELP